MVKKLIIVIFIGIVSWLGYAAYARNQQVQILQKLVQGHPDPAESITSVTSSGHGYSYDFDFFSDAVNTTKTNISTPYTDVMYARPGKTEASYSISFTSNRISAICTAASTHPALYAVTLSSGIYPVCTTTKRAAEVLNFKDSVGVWHQALLLNPILSLPLKEDSTFMRIFSSIKVN